jgi:hypothetical protein
VKPKVHTSQVIVRRGPRGRGWTWAVVYFEQPESSGWEPTRERALLQARRAKRLLNREAAT